MPGFKALMSGAPNPGRVLRDAMVLKAAMKPGALAALKALTEDDALEPAQIACLSLRTLSLANFKDASEERQVEALKAVASKRIGSRERLRQWFVAGSKEASGAQPQDQQPQQPSSSSDLPPPPPLPQVDDAGLANSSAAPPPSPLQQPLQPPQPPQQQQAAASSGDLPPPPPPPAPPAAVNPATPSAIASPRAAGMAMMPGSKYSIPPSLASHFDLPTATHLICTITDSEAARILFDPIQLAKSPEDLKFAVSVAKLFAVAPGEVLVHFEDQTKAIIDDEEAEAEEDAEEEAEDDEDEDEDDDDDDDEDEGEGEAEEAEEVGGKKGKKGKKASRPPHKKAALLDGKAVEEALSAAEKIGKRRGRRGSK